LVAHALFADDILVRVQVLGRMKQTMVANSSRLTHSFLLDDDSTLPFVANKILAQMDDMEGVGDHWMLHDKVSGRSRGSIQYVCAR
jgi:hypothetical protein